MSSKPRKNGSSRRSAPKLDIAYLLNEEDITARPGSSSRRGPSSGAVPNARPYSCSFCSVKFEHRTLLTEHVNKYHKSNAMHKCNECSATFGEKGNLNRHIKSVHRGEKPYKCELCPMAFPFRDTLQRHVKAVHEHQRPYPCKVCDMRFKKRDHLQRHSMSQHGSRP